MKDNYHLPRPRPLHFKHILLFAYLTMQLILVICNSSLAQNWEDNLFFRNINTKDGLSNPTTNCIYQDSRGFIWIGTVGGLNKYDGYEFKVFEYNPSDSNSLPNNRINALYEDSDNNLWIATSGGLAQLNYKNDRIKTFKTSNSLDQVYEIAYDGRNNRVWMVTSNGGLSFLDLESLEIQRFHHDLINYSGAYKLLVLDNNLFIGSRNSGLFSLDLESFVVEEFCNTQNGRFQTASNFIFSLHAYNNELLIGTAEGLIKYNFGDEKPTYYNQTSLLPSSAILSIAHDRHGDLYLSTNYGFAILNVETGLISSYRKKAGNPSTLSSNRLRSVFVDKNDNVWIGTVQKGFDYLNRKSRSMTLVIKEYNTTNTLSGTNMACFAQDDNGGLWIGTKETGLNYYTNGQYQHFQADGSKHSYNNNNATDIAIDDNGIVWISAYNGGLYAYKDGKFENFQTDKSDPNALHVNNVRDIEIGNKGILWLATDEGLESYDQDKNVFSHHYLERENKIGVKRKNIRCILQDSEGKIYAGTNSGLYIYDPTTSKADHFLANPTDSNALGNNTIIELFEDSKKRIWLGSRGGGLIRFNRQNKTFKSYTQKDGFPDNAIKSIEEDALGNLWMGTNNGIIRFTPDSKQVATFGNSYGLQNSAFSIKASIKLTDGRLIFGGPDGFNVLNPANLEPENSDIEVIFTELKLFDRIIYATDKDSILQENISLVQRLNLSYQQAKHFTLDFSVLNYFNTGQLQYAYKLEGFDDSWNYINKQHHVAFTNLEPGDYLLKVMASDNGIWDNPVKELRISIPTPWFMTIMFKLGIIMLIAGIIISFYFYRSYNFKRNQRILETLVAEQNKEISAQNEELQSINKELVSQNEEVVKQKDFIDSQNSQLAKVQEELKMANLTLEEKIKIRTKELVESNRTLDKTVKELDRFVYSASHDLSAPLKSVLGLVNIAKLDDKGGNLQVHLNYIEDSIIKQENVIKNLIQYSRNARQAVKPESINLFNLVNQVILDLRYLPGSDRVDMTNNLAEGEVIVTDEQRMKMVLNNLLSNGIKYQDRNNNDSFVKIDLTKDTSSWRLMVEDNGQGIAEDQQRKIFDMFHRANEQSEGSGLGLFIVMEAVERLGGKISVKSSLNKGSVFELEFPVM